MRHDHHLLTIHRVGRQERVRVGDGSGEEGLLGLESWPLLP